MLLGGLAGMHGQWWVRAVPPCTLKLTDTCLQLLLVQGSLQSTSVGLTEFESAV